MANNMGNTANNSNLSVGIDILPNDLGPVETRDSGIQKIINEQRTSSEGYVISESTYGSQVNNNLSEEQAQADADKISEIRELIANYDGSVGKIARVGVGISVVPDSID